METKSHGLQTSKQTFVEYARQRTYNKYSLW